MVWIALQSNSLADLISVEQNFEEALTNMKEDLKKEEWIFPTLHANMRNQVNIAKINVEKGRSYGDMQCLIEKLISGSTLIGEVPLLIKVGRYDWETKKDEVLKHCIELMNQKSEKNVVVLWDRDYYFKDVTDDIKRVIKGKKIVSYPSKDCQKEDILVVKDFVENSGHILITKSHYFNGCEAANIIFLTHGGRGIRNFILRGVQNIICVQILGGAKAQIRGMKEDNRFL